MTGYLVTKPFGKRIDYFFLLKEAKYFFYWKPVTQM